MMKIKDLHSWNVPPKEAVQIQKKLAGLVSIKKLQRGITSVAGTDISYDKNSDTLFAAVLVFTFPKFQLIEMRESVQKASFPYVPGLLSFREIPPLIDCFEQLETIPDVLLCDAHGMAHPRRFGLACHLGLLTGLSSVGCAKSRLTGKGSEPDSEKGSWTPLIHEGCEIGRIVRTKNKVRPLYISTGNLVDLDSAVSITLQCCGKYRLPEPTRQAHLAVNRLRVKYIESA